MATFIWRRRVGATAMLVATLLAVLVFIEARWSRQVLATSGGSPYEVPEIVDTNPDPDIVETSITAQGAVVNIGNGTMASVLTYNGSIPGPIFRLKVGDTVIVHFENNIGHNTGIHWHGIELENAADGTTLTQNQVPPGGKYLYKFTVTRPGIYWYHPHHHSSTNQVFKGLYGEIIVTDPNEAALEAAGTIPGPSQTVPLALSDITVCKSVNDLTMYDITAVPPLPWAGDPVGGLVADQPNPTSPKSLCLNAADGGNARDEDGNPRATSFNAGDVPNTQPPGNPGSTSGPVNEGQTVITNGINVGGRAGTPSAPGALAPGAQTLVVQAGQGLRLQVGNTATTRFFRLRLTDETGTKINLVRIGGQGGLLDNARVEGGMPGGFDTLVDSGEILLDPGDRADLVVAIPPTATGVLTLWTLDSQRAGGILFSRIPSVPVMHLQTSGVAASTFTIAHGTPLRAATGSPVEVLGAATATLLDPATFAPPKIGLSSQEMKLTNLGNKLGVDEKQGAHDFPGDYTAVPHADSARYAASLGDILELQVTNTTNAHHPFHLHGFSMQPLTLTKAASPTFTFPPEYKDNVDVPRGYTLTFRIRLDDRPLIDGTTMGGGLGRWVFHCHIFFHATFGMISELVVTTPDGRERPYVNANDVSVSGNAGDHLTVHGTYVDTDGEAVTLEASVGTVSDDGGGQWTWEYDAADTNPEFAYITATDAGGRKDQAAFALDIQEPPVVTVSPASGDEGAAIPIHATAIDPNGDPLTKTWSYAPAVGVDPGALCAIASASSLDTTISCTDDGTYTLTMTVSDGVNPEVVKNATLTVSNVPPATSISTPVAGAQFLAGDPVSLIADFTDAGLNDLQSCSIDWGDGAITPGIVAGAPGSGTCSGSHMYADAGNRTITATVTDDDGGGSADSVAIVIFTAKSLKQEVLAEATVLLAAATKKDEPKLKDVVKKLTDSVGSPAWIDGNHLEEKKGDDVFKTEKEAAKKLEELLDKGDVPPATLQAMIDKLIHADQILAGKAVAAAIAAMGNPHKIEEAQNELAKAVDELAALKFSQAIDHYGKAWKKALDALH